jgi:arylformamidase
MSSDPEIARQIAALGRTLTPELVAATARIFEPLQLDAKADADVTSDISYGPHPRHRLDVFRPAGARNAPVLLFAGGGSLMVAQSGRGHPLRANVARWAARCGLIGVAMTFRLAPEYQWPAGSDDVARAVDWIRQHGAAFGGDPARLFVMGHSAGAGHVASFVARAERPGCAGAILLSGIYNILTLPGGPNKAYFGDDPALYPQRVALPGLVETNVPLLVAVSEYDPPQFKAQALELVAAVRARRGRPPRFVRLPGHNHASIAHHIGAVESSLTAEILDFVRTG